MQHRTQHRLSYRPFGDTLLLLYLVTGPFADGRMDIHRRQWNKAFIERLTELTAVRASMKRPASLLALGDDVQENLSVLRFQRLRIRLYRDHPARLPYRVREVEPGHHPRGRFHQDVQISATRTGALGYPSERARCYKARPFQTSSKPLG